MARRGGDLSTFFTFGGRVPASVGLLVAIMGVASVGAALDPRIAAMAALAPDAIVRGEIWRLITWPFVQRDVLGLLFGGFMLWSLGQQLSYTWSERRFVARFVVYTLGASIGTILIAFVWPYAGLPHLGIWPIVIALLVAWAMMFPDRQVSFWGVLPMTARMLALLAVGATVLSGLFGGGIRGIGSVTPHLVAAGIAWFQARSGARRRSAWSAQARRWWNEREQKRRAKHLKVVRKNGSDDRPRWMN